MKKIPAFFIISAFLLGISVSGLYGAVNEIVRLSGFSPKIFDESVSRFALESDSADFSLIETPFQKTVALHRGAESTALTVETGAGRGISTPPADVQRLLRDTRFLTITAPEITAKARACAVSADPVYAVEEFVHRTISRKITGIPLLPALNILKNRTGDCTEHSVLSVSLLRAQKIPCRAVVGMVLVRDYSGEKNVFVFHMWVEAWYRGAWRLVDATSPGRKKSNIYIAFTDHSLQTESPLSYLRAVSAIQNLKVRYSPPSPRRGAKKSL